ncbi:HNH endonuclease signature motif containing protein [Demequina capsici]|uniref:HNH endonuclease signature motif containing protein n=1 Tax=Demequina capsici TaxID=3075620 RepID=UPI0035E4078D
MARRAPSRCTRCSRLATEGGRCDEHQRKPWENPSANSLALSGGEREQLRNALLARGDTCAWCGTDEHLELDHIIEIADGGDARDLRNCQLLCTEHHRRKTLTIAKARRNSCQPKRV